MLFLLHCTDFYAGCRSASPELAPGDAVAEPEQQKHPEHQQSGEEHPEQDPEGDDTEPEDVEVLPEGRTAEELEEEEMAAIAQELLDDMEEDQDEDSPACEASDCNNNLRQDDHQNKGESKFPSKGSKLKKKLASSLKCQTFGMVPAASAHHDENAYA